MLLANHGLGNQSGKSGPMRFGSGFASEPIDDTHQVERCGSEHMLQMDFE
jgi:hypothetical protein